ncbi:MULTISPECIES: hypothetical protein [unclassified Candidatus Tisiphia]|uniref:hypothetical protein n=1 Tax=unclassified Candidatus Tisiphia TaxID=2996318 RepID=UPI00312C71BA
MIQILYSKIYMQCYNTPCGEKYTQNKETYNEWYYRASNLNIEAVDDKTGKATFSYYDALDAKMHQGEVIHSCDLKASRSDTLSRDNNKQISKAIYHTLPNDNCMIAGESPQTPTKEFPTAWSRLYGKCLPEPCNNQSFSSGENEANLSWGENLDDISIKTGKNNDTAEVSFRYYSPDSRLFESHSIDHVCDLPVLTPSIKESSSTTTSTTPEQITEAFLASLITEASTVAKNTTQAESSTPTTPQDQTPPSAKEWTVKNIVDTAVSSGVAILTVLAAGAFLYKKGSDIYEACLEYLSKSDPKLKDCNGHGLLESDQFIPSNDNGDAKVIQDLSVSLTGAEDLVTSEV